MTNEEVIRMLTRLKDQINFEWTDAQKKMDALNVAIEALQGQRWIPCSERLPDGRLNKSYLVQDKDGRRAVGTYTNWGWMFGHYMNDPVAWMPLPEPYTRGEEE